MYTIVTVPNSCSFENNYIFIILLQKYQWRGKKDISQLPFLQKKHDIFYPNEVKLHF